MLRNYGQEKRHDYKLKGFNSRLDELQAAILWVKLKYLDAWNNRRREVADLYTKHIDNPHVIKPHEIPYGRHVFHLYVIRHPKRDLLQRYLEERGVQTAIHYPVPIHLQEAYQDLGYPAGSFPVAEKFAKEIVSLPMFPQLKEEEIVAVAKWINHFE